MGLSWNQTKLLQGGFASLNYNNNQQKEARIIALDSQINTLQQRIATLNNSNANNKAERIAEYKNKLEQLIKEKIELEKGMANTNIETPFNIFSKNTDETSTQEATIAAKDISNETILANSGVVINKYGKEEKTNLQKANEEYTKAINAQQEAINKLNAFAKQNNFPRSTRNLSGLAGTQIRLEDLQAGRQQNLIEARKTNTPEYQEYQKLVKEVSEASKAVTETKMELETTRRSALQEAKNEAESKFNPNRIEIEKVIAEKVDSTFKLFS